MVEKAAPRGAGAKAETAPRRRRVARSEDVRQQILQAAQAIFQAEGVAGLSIRRIAAKVGIPTMTIYGYFTNKVAIIRSIWSLAFEPLFAELEAVAAREADPRLRLTAVCAAYVDYWIAHPDFYRIIFLIEDRRETGEEGWFVDQSGVVQSYMRFAGLIAEAQGLDEADCLHQGEALICALTGVAHMGVTVSEYPWSPARDYVAVIIKAFGGA